jgi:hypothetical protein
MGKKADRENKLEDPKGDFPKAHKEVNYIYSGPDSYVSRRKQKLISQEVITVSLTTPDYLKWFEVHITFDRSAHPNFIPMPERYHHIISPIVKDVKLNRVLVDGGSSLNIHCWPDGLSRSALCPSRAPFCNIIPSAAATLVGQIAISVGVGKISVLNTCSLR